MRKMSGLVIMAAAVALTTGLAQAKPARAQATAKPEMVRSDNSGFEKAPWWVKTPVIAQIGYVRTEVEANRAFFNAQFQSVGKTPAEAQNKAIAQTKALSNVLKKLGAENVRVTTSFSMRTLYEQYRDKAGNRIEDQRADKIEAYQVDLQISLEVRDTSVLEKAYALVLAANPTSSSGISYSLVPTNEIKTWLFSQAVMDAQRRAKLATDAAGANLGRALVIDPTSRACQTDVLARGGNPNDDGMQAQEVDSARFRSARADYAPALMVTAPPPSPMTAEQQLEVQALKNPFIQTPPMQELTEQACVVYGLN